MQIYKQNNRNRVIIYGSDKPIKLYLKKPFGENKKEYAFNYKHGEYFLSEFLNIHNSAIMSNPPEWMKEFNGILNETAFSGVLIKILDNIGCVKAYTYTNY